ncbi:hypothetical protein [Luteolibacter luteus]|uniref:Uncharacterized protein n=1 Tax=Luteolibacter luteus TaxID=2728835 RepID=A0A858RHL2_9BACT|nr:hypothetical protein [Luteolibacter luteus]QJE96195.1 hypothetical protein HHL09_10495 [Luteolibacter luteus]
MKTIPSLLRPITAGAIQVLPSAAALADGADNFNDNSKSAVNWGTDGISGNGALTETSQRLQYTCPTGTFDDSAERPWELTRFPYNANWEVQIDAVNNTAPSPPLQVNSMGIRLLSPHSAGDYLYHEFYNSAIGGPSRQGANADMTFGGSSLGGADSSELAVDRIGLRMTWDSKTKVLTTYYDTNLANGYQWTILGTFGLEGSGGDDANANWGLAGTDQFFLSVYGFSAFMSVPAGQMHLDNFSETGGVGGSGGTRPQPVGNFPFVFPGGNAALTRILSITGNYQGISPSPGQRAYSIDLAQDESGKVSAMGTMEGILDENGSPTIAMDVGSVKTVNEEPFVQLKGSFKGELDGLSTHFKGNASVPLEVVDLDPGEQGIQGSGNFTSKVGGVPSSGKNMQIEVPASPEALDNLKQDWSLDLDIALKAINGKQRTVASAKLVLPNGDIIQYPEKIVKYSEQKGYRITFKKGTNISADPDAPDKKSTVILTGLRFEKTGDSWEPVAGTITYKFLGQSGTENLMEFVPPP